ncbi:hypothetical protein [Pectobacterium carotovorum]|nr:hypothetical protein [Pectobacterium carotovorum]
MFNELVFVEGNTDKDHPYLGGSPFLPASIACKWFRLTPPCQFSINIH